MCGNLPSKAAVIFVLEKKGWAVFLCYQISIVFSKVKRNFAVGKTGVLHDHFAYFAENISTKRQQIKEFKLWTKFSTNLAKL